MKVLNYISMWNGEEHPPRIISESEAIIGHKNRTFHGFLLGNSEEPLIAISSNSGGYRVAFLKKFNNVGGLYFSGDKEPLFLHSGGFTLQDDLNSRKSIDVTFLADGSVGVTITVGARQKRYRGRGDVSKNWCNRPEFGKYDEIIDVERWKPLLMEAYRSVAIESNRFVEKVKTLKDRFTHITGVAIRDAGLADDPIVLLRLLGLTHFKLIKPIMLDKVLSGSADGAAICTMADWSVVFDIRGFGMFDGGQDDGIWPEEFEQVLDGISKGAEVFAFILHRTTDSFGFSHHVDGRRRRVLLLQKGNPVVSVGQPDAAENEVYKNKKSSEEALVEYAQSRGLNLHPGADIECQVFAR